MHSGERIAIIGSGAAGLAAIRVLTEKIDRFPFNPFIQCFERTDKLGGIWNYLSDSSDQFTTPMYKSLRTNLPTELMAYPDFPFTTETSFVHHSEVLKYLKAYANKYDLNSYIKYNMNVQKVHLVVENNKQMWELTIRNSSTSEITVSLFDVLFICNGHFEKPYIPKIAGIENFKGQCIHSIHYRIPEIYKDKVICVLGARSSGIDIALELSHVAKKVYLSHNKDRLKWKSYPNNFVEVYGINFIDEHGNICTSDGTKFDADVLMLCTGYDIDMSFLSRSCDLQYDDCYIRPLYQHMIHPNHFNNLFVIGVAYEVLPFTLFYLQSKVARAIIQNCSIQIPLEKDSLLKSVQKYNEEMEKLNVDTRHRHWFGTKQFSYFKWCQEVSSLLITFPIPRHLESMYIIVKKWRFEDSEKYRDITMELKEDSLLGFCIKYGPEDDFYSKHFEDLEKRWSANVIH